MTAHKHFKQLVRARMAKTGESYSSARRHLLSQVAEPRPAPNGFHFPGNIPAAAALRALLAHAGVRNPRDRAPFSEAMVFGIAGGIGAGMFAFHYAKEDFSSFYLAGRHLWQDYLRWTQGALQRLGIKAVVRESSGVKPAEKQLRELLEPGRPVMAWVDAGSLPYRGMPAHWSGGGYHLITVHRIDEGAGMALVGDLADETIALPLPELAAARARIKSFKNRLLAVEPAGKPPQLAALVQQGIQACVDGLTKQKAKNFTLEGFAIWANRLDGSKAVDGWEKAFPPGPHLYQGLWSINEFIEHFGTGGGLCRPTFAEFLEAAAAATGDKSLSTLAARYAGLGAKWSELADAALPDSVPAFRKTKALLARKAELFHSEGAAATAEIKACWTELAEQAQRMKKEFPLSSVESARLRRELQRRVTELYQGEIDALQGLRGWLLR